MQESDRPRVTAVYEKLCQKRDALKRELEMREDVTVMAASLTLYAAAGVFYQLTRIRFATIESTPNRGTITRFADPDLHIDQYLELLQTKSGILQIPRRVSVFISHRKAIAGRPAIQIIGSLRLGIGMILLLGGSLIASGSFTARSLSRERDARTQYEYAEWQAWDREPPPLPPAPTPSDQLVI